MSTGIVNALLPRINSILGVRDSIGAIIRPVYFVTRQWYVDQALTIKNNQPEGFAKDTTVQLLPTPMLKDFSQDIRLREGGTVKAGDIVLRGVSKASYKEADIDGTTSDTGVQKFYLVGDKLYQVINVTEKYVTWDVQIRELTNQTRY